jgi:beta-glucanase (GH16 family)
MTVLGLGFGSAAQAASWNEDFNSFPSSANWTFETGGGGWGNNELEYYQQANASVANGILTIQARQESVGGMPYTSSRLNTAGHHDWTFGTIEARIQGPNGQGYWPAFWMLGSDISTVPWPGCGEIDIMEHINAVNTAYGTIHWDFNGHASYTGSTPTADFTQWHTYGIIWDTNAISWTVDGAITGAANIQNAINGTEEFQKPFFIILNFAVGGTWPGNPDGSTVFPANYNIDYIHVTQAGSATPTSTAAPTATRTSTATATRTATVAATPTANPGVLISQGKTATASSLENSTFPASNAVDGNTGTRWSSAFSDPQWITVDLGGTASIRTVTLNWEAAYATAYQIQTSTDNVNWTTQVTPQGAGGVVSFNMTATGRYVRVYCTTRATPYGYSLWEFQVYGTMGATPTATATATATATTTTTTGGGTATATRTATATATRTATATATPTTGGGACAGVPAFAYCTAYASGASITYNSAKYHSIAPIPATRDCPPNSPYSPSTDNWWVNDGGC